MMERPGTVLRVFGGLLGALAFVLAPSGCRKGGAGAGSPSGEIVRVCLLQNVERVDLTSGAPLVAKSAQESEGRRLNFPDNNAQVPLLLAHDGWRIGNVALASGELTIVPAADGAVRVNGKSYRGQYRFVPVSPGRFDVVNDVGVDAYLKGVLPGELPRSWSDEAYKAQAITARTYALYSRWEARTYAADRHFDVYDDTRSQVYSGMDAETEKSQAAADATAGVVVAFGPKGQERIFKAYFSSCCGGVGQSVADAFKEEPIAPLTERNVGSLCNASPKFTWPAVVLSKSELTRRIKVWGARRGRPEKDMAELTRIDVANYNQFGRPVRFTFTDARGTRFSMSGEEARWSCNADANGGPTLPSSFFKPVNEPDAIRFADGHGFGHGVGLCQWCTEAQAGQGMRHEDIVLIAFPRARLVRAY